MKKFSIALLLAFLTFSLAACSENVAGEDTEEASEESIAAETATASGEYDPNAENPMVMIMDDAEFTEKLGMAVDTTKIPVPGMARYIINDEIAYFCFGVQEGENESADVLLRATKKKDLKENLRATYDSETKLEDVKVCGVNVERTDFEPDGQVYHQYEFEKDGIYYCLVIRGEISEELFETLFASFLEAVRPA